MYLEFGQKVKFGALSLIRTNLLLLPGLLCDAALWRHQVTALHNIANCFVADLSQDDNVDAMAQRVLQTAPERFALAGLSMGGYVAFAILRAAPERVTRLCLMDSNARADTEAQIRRRKGLIALTRRMPATQFRGVTPRLLPSLLHPDHVNDTALADEIYRMAERVGREAFLRQMQAILSRPDSRPELRNIQAPTVVLVGEADQLTPPEFSAEMAADIPGAALHILPRCGHLPPLEQPEIVAKHFCAWLEAEATYI
jgi:pimeloyl-ACP methyl ester carboxylesterase